MKKVSFLMIILILILASIVCEKKIQKKEEINIAAVKNIGIYEAKREEEMPFQFSSIYSVDCDTEGNIYILDGEENCLKIFDRKGNFIKTLLAKGKGPKEITNAYKIRINPFTGNIFVLQEYGYQLKEFNPSGEHIELYALPEQFFYYSDFIDKHRLLFVSMGRNNENTYSNFKILNLKTLKIEKEFAPTNRESMTNGTMRFIIKNEILWTCPGDEMKLAAYDLNSRKKIKNIKIDEKYKKIKFLKGQNWIRAVPYNYGQPLMINNQIYVLVAKIEYTGEDSIEAVHTPKSQQFFLYSLENDQLIKQKELTEIADKELTFLGCVWKNRLFFYKQEPFPMIQILEVEVPL